MPHWAEKGRLYRFGFGVMILGFVGFTVAFGVPAWKREGGDGDTPVLYSGLWQYMCDGLTNCRTYTGVEGDTRLLVSRVLACIALAFCFISLFLIFLHNCTAYSKSLQSENAFVSVFPVFCGGLSLASCVVNQAIGTIGWGVILGVTGSCCSIAGGMFMCLGLHFDRRRATRTERTSNPYLHGQTAFNRDMTAMAIPMDAIPSDRSQANMQVSSIASSTNTVPHLATQVDQQPRLDPSAPPPDPDFLYY
ncbi:uncharacterized protein LOC124127921 [Haliotis rufescens]|uniref:uncharacterized protein LOC124127921 n=1 Tax=Haliotis rufescens TaxID=6454 RepID=UPI00201EF319|nr:uncharacterized protein LOC124127921 [Haliotis rufescens]